MDTPGRFREPTSVFRGCAAETALLTPISWRDFIRMHGFGFILAMFVAVSGAFGTSHITPDVRYPIITALTLVVIAIDLGNKVVFERWIRFEPPRLRLAVRALVLLTCIVLVCWGAARLFEGARATPPPVRFILPIIIFGAVVAAFRRLTAMWREPTRVPNTIRPAFVDRLPRSLQDADIVAVEGEDHYVCIHTSLGRHLLLMRFGDALGELNMLDGLQTHRSWWVAKSAVAAVKRGNGRATLKLANGLEAPVSRRYAQGLRKRGWY